MTGKLKTKGNMMLATKLDTVLKVSFYEVILQNPWILISATGSQGEAVDRIL